MSFSNFLHPLFSLGCYVEMPLWQYPWAGCGVEGGAAGVKVEESLPTLESPVSQQCSKEVDLEVIEGRLLKMHFESEHHRKTHWTAEEDKLLERLV